MWTFTAPLWLAAGVALALPVVIHLLGRGRGRRVRVGSVRWIPAGTLRRARSLRPHRPLLLLVRCLLIAAVVLALARPRAPRPLAAAKTPSPWVLIHPELLDQRERLERTHAELYRELDALRARGARVRLLRAGLPGPGRGGGATAAPWSLLREADALAPPAVGFEVFTPARQSLFRGERPRLAREVEWRTARTGWAQAEPPSPRPPLRVDLRFSADRSTDARYVGAGLRAVAALGDPSLELRERALEAGRAQTGGAALQFRLSPEPVPAVLRNGLEAGSLLVSDAGERYDGRAAWLDGAAWGLPEGIRLHRLGGAPGSAGAVLWRDTRGRPVLTAERAGGGLWLRFHSRFHPAWSELVLDPAFPRWLRELARRVAGGNEAAPEGPELPAAVVAPGRLPTPARAPARWPWPEASLWGAAALLLPLERWLATGRSA